MFMERLTELYSQGGSVMFAITGVSILAWYLAVQTWWRACRQRTWLDRFQASALRESGEDTLGSTTRVGRFDILAFEAEVQRLEYGLSIVGILATELPLLGLLGTVVGMLVSFEVIQIHGTAQPRLLARGVGQALLTTQAGLWTALPILFFHHIMSNQVQSLRSRIEVLIRACKSVDRHGHSRAEVQSRKDQILQQAECKIAGG
jgi:biopolymer transport protein ExbB